MEEKKYSMLERIGLTNSEIKVYTALLKIGTSKKAEIIREAKIAPSKLYDVLDKLIDKGLTSVVTKNSIKHFSAAPPNRIKDYLTKKKEEISKEELLFENLMPELENLQKKQSEEKTKIEVFTGWEGMETIYNVLLNNAGKEDNIFIFGAGKGKNEERFQRFYARYSKEILKKRVNIKIIFDKSSKEYVTKIEKKIGSKYNKRFLDEDTPSEVLIHKNIVIIVMKKQEPIVIVINDSETAQSFKTYFNQLWKNSEN